MKKVLVIIDMQNDFIDGSLANPIAQAIVKPICDLIKEWEGDICFTLDTHDDKYLKTREGQNLPIEHCIKDKNGWSLNKEIKERMAYSRCRRTYIRKPSFGYKDWKDVDYVSASDEIVIVGTCTEICVMHAVSDIQTAFPEKKITVLKDLCAGLTPETHEMALKLMKINQINIE